MGVYQSPYEACPHLSEGGAYRSPHEACPHLSEGGAYRSPHEACPHLSEGGAYRSPYEAYPFLADEGTDLTCDFELYTDELSSLTGLLAAQAPAWRQQLLRVAELIYHANPALRTRLTLTPEEIRWLEQQTKELEEQAGGPCRRFVLPQGCPAACVAHLARVRAKCLVRLLYRAAQRGIPVPDALLDFTNLLSGYFFQLALVLNREAGVEELDFVSRSYTTPAAKE